ncbi:MAG TPA: alkaline phosphatase family protein [Acidimicrobiales bacterium]|nr:alkaline phosphatase family protein [Acidimicrobiales bacterium]
MPPEHEHAMDYLVVVVFENRSFDNLLGCLYAPGEVPAFEGVIGKDLSNPIPAWAEDGRDHGVVPYAVASGMDSPDPDPGEEYQHTNTQLFGVLDEANRYKDATEMVAPYNAPPAGREPTMDGFVTDYISFFTREMGRQPSYDEYRQIMTGYTPEQVPVISEIARHFGVFDHWFSEVPSQTLTNRSFWTAATASGFVVNRPMTAFMHRNDAETIFERLEQHGRTWKVYVLEPEPISFTGMIHMARLRGSFATNFVPFSEFERDAAAGTLPSLSLIEPNLLAGHGDYHPAFGRALLPGVEIPVDPPSSILAGEAFLARVYDAVKSARSPTGANAFNTTLLIGWDEPGGTYDHVPPGPVPPPDPSAPTGELGFKFDRSGYRVPAIVVSPWVEEGVVLNEEYRHTSMIATLRKLWGLGAPLSARDAAARTFDHVLSRDVPRDPETWPRLAPRPVSSFQLERVEAGRALGTLGRHLCHGLRLHADEAGITLPRVPSDPIAEISPALALDIVNRIGARYFPRLARPPERRRHRNVSSRS